MDKILMREWLSSLEAAIDNKLKNWRKSSRIENGEVVQIEHQFLQTHIIIDVFWHDHQETVHLQYFGPRAKHSFTWHGLNNHTFNKILDRIGNLAQITMHPVVDATD
jgi:hypothetical protein